MKNFSNIDNLNFFNYNLVGKNTLVKLRLINFEDIVVFRKFITDSRIWQYFAYEMYNIDDMDNYIMEAVAQKKSGIRYYFAIENVQNGEVLGSTALSNYSKNDCRIEIGWSWLELKVKKSTKILNFFC